MFSGVIFDEPRVKRALMKSYVPPFRATASDALLSPAGLNLWLGPQVARVHELGISEITRVIAAGDSKLLRGDIAEVYTETY